LLIDCGVTESFAGTGVAVAVGAGTGLAVAVAVALGAGVVCPPDDGAGVGDATELWGPPAEAGFAVAVAVGAPAALYCDEAFALDEVKGARTIEIGFWWAKTAIAAPVSISNTAHRTANAHHGGSDHCRSRMRL
jgi:hypothetical protein